MKVDKNIFYKLIRFISIFMFFYIIFLLLLIDTNVNYIHMNNSKFSNCIVVLFLIIAILILRKVSVKFRKCNMKAEYIDIIIKILFFGLLFFQFIVIESILFKTRWDVEQIMNAANDLSKTGVLSNNNYYSQYPYFDIYPNNVLLTFIFSLIIRLGNMFNFHNGYKMCVCVGTLLVDLSGIFLSKTVYNLTENNKLKLLSFILFVLLIGISPWFLIPYSDTYSIFLTTLVLYNYTKKEKKYLNYFAIGLISCFGYLIKPTCLIVLIAIFIVEFYLLLLRNNKFNSKSIMKILACLLGVTVIFFYNSIICKYIKYEQNYKYTFTPYHYLMMGTNCETLGTYSSEDVLNSINIMDYNKRIEYNKKVFMERFNSMTLVEKIKFYSKKILINYNDGTFAWGREGGFYGRRYNSDTLLTKFFSSLYYNNHKNYFVFSSFAQIVWLLVLLFIFIELLIDSEYSKYKTVIILCLIGITLFTLLFEARARYLYLYLPYYIVIATMGIHNFINNGNKIKFKN